MLTLKIGTPSGDILEVPQEGDVLMPGSDQEREQAFQMLTNALAALSGFTLQGSCGATEGVTPTPVKETGPSPAAPTGGVVVPLRGR